MKVFIKNIYKFDFTPVIFCRFFTIMKIIFDKIISPDLHYVANKVKIPASRS